MPVIAVRVTYVGELGWELYCPTEYGLTLWDTLWEPAPPHGMVAGGYRAIDALRVEKGYRVWGADVTPDDTPYEAGLGFAVRLDKGASSAATRCVAREGGGPRTRLARLVLADPQSVCLGASRYASTARSSAGSRAAATASASSAASRTRTCPRTRRSARGSRSRCSASGSGARSSATRCTTRRATAHPGLSIGHHQRHDRPALRPRLVRRPRPCS